MPFSSLATSIAPLPWWLLYPGLLALAFAEAYLFQRVGGYLILRRLRSEQPQHWAERARLAFPYATFTIFHLMIVSIGWLVVGTHLWANLWGSLPLVGAACLGIHSCSRPTWTSLRGTRKGATAKRPLMLVGLPFLNAISVLLPVLVVVSLPKTSQVETWLAVPALTLGLIAYRAWFSIPLARVLGILQPAPEPLEHQVENLARERGMPPPKTYVIRSETANAFALTTCHSLGFTSDALEILSRAERETIIQHELAHLAESPALRWLRACSVVIYAPLIAIPPLIGQFDHLGLWIGLLAYLILSRLWGHISRRFERLADTQAKHRGAGDADGAETSDSTLENSHVYAGALEKLYQHNLVPAVLRGKGLSHPNLYDRLLDAGVTPDFPRPKPPPRGPLILAVASALVGLASLLKLLPYLGDRMP
ncbi:MAG: M48 family metallopeptidase [Verrucomicrobiales bacterium]